jgi:hypothetical protein
MSNATANFQLSPRIFFRGVSCLGAAIGSNLPEKTDQLYSGVLSGEEVG